MQLLEMIQGYQEIQRPQSWAGGWEWKEGAEARARAPPPSQLELGAERQGCLGTERAAHTPLEKQAGWLSWLSEEGQESLGVWRAQGGAPQWGASWGYSLWQSGQGRARS